MMRNSVFLASLFISTSLHGAEPKFHFQDCVTVVSGFYKACHGTVRAVSNISSYPRDNRAYNVYDVYLTCKNNESMLAMLKESELEMMDGRKCDDTN
jgi:hypothetical protein